MTQYILPDSAYAPGVIPTFEELDKNKHGSIRWLSQSNLMQEVAAHTAKEAPRTNQFESNVGDPFYHTDQGSIVKPGMLPALEATTFIAERTYQSAFHQRCTYTPIIAKRVRHVRYGTEDHVESLTAVSDGKQRTRDEVRRDQHKFIDDELVSEPYVETADFTREDLKNSLVGQRFIQEYLNVISEKRQWNLGTLELYSIRDSSASDTDGLHANDGLLQKLDEAHTFYEENIEDNGSSLYGQGYYCGIHGTGTDKVAIDASKNDRDEKGNVIEQMVDMTTQYYTQAGMPMGKEFLVSPELYGQLSKLSSRERETQRGDAIYFDGGALQINGVPIIPAMELAFPENGFNQHVLLGNFKSGVEVGVREDFNTEINYDFDKFMWKVSTFFDFGLRIMNINDVLAAEVTGLPSQTTGSDTSP